MAEIRLFDRTFEPFITATEIDEAIQKMAKKISADYAGEEVVFLGVLNGAFMFLSDLVRYVELPNAIEFVRVKSYSGIASTGTVKELLNFPENLDGKHVIIVEDIIESGNTIEYLSKKLESMNPTSVKFCALLFKPEQYKKEIPISYTAFEITKEFVVGYGLDYDGAGRSLKDIYQETRVKQ